MKKRGHTVVHKGLTGLALLAMVAIDKQRENPTAWVCLALDGAYGLLRVWQGRIFLDKSRERQAGLGYGLVIFLGSTL